MAENFDNVTPDLDIEHIPDVDTEELSDKEIDDILGKETRDNEGMSVILENDALAEEMPKSKTQKNKRNFKKPAKKPGKWDRPYGDKNNWYKGDPIDNNNRYWDDERHEYSNNYWDNLPVKEMEHGIWDRENLPGGNFWDNSENSMVGQEKEVFLKRNTEDDTSKKNDYADDSSTATDSAYHHVHIITGDEEYLKDIEREPVSLEGNSASNTVEDIKDLSIKDSTDLSKAIEDIRRNGGNNEAFTFNSYAEPLIHNNVIDNLQQRAEVSDSNYHHVKIQRPEQTFSEPTGASATVRPGLCPGCGNPIALCNCNKDSKENKDDTKSGANESISEARQIHEQNAKAFRRMTSLDNQFQSIASIPGSVVASTSTTDTAIEGVRELKNSAGFQAVRILLSNSGAGSVVSSMNDRDEQIAGVIDKIDKAKAAGTLKVSDFGSKKGLFDVLKQNEFNKFESVVILRNREFLQAKLSMREEMTKLVTSGRIALTEDEFKFLNSKEYFSSNLTSKELAEKRGGDFVNVQGKLLEKYLKAQGVALPRNIDISKLKSREIKGLVKNAEKHGFNTEHKRLLKEYGKAVKKREIGMKLQRFGRIKRLFRLAASELVRGDETYGLVYNKTTSAIRKAKVTYKLSKVTVKAIAKVTGLSYLANKVVKPAIANKIVKPISAKASEAKGFAKGKINAGTKSLSDKFKATRAGHGVTKAKKGVDKVKGGVKSTAHRIGQTKGFKIAKKAGKGTKKALKVTKKVIKTPFKIIDTVFGFINKIKLLILAFVGKMLLILIVLAMILTFIMGLLESLKVFSEGLVTTKTILDEITNAHETIIEYDSYKDMRADIEMMREWDKEVYKEAKKYGEGRVEEPYNHVHYGHTIDYYGCPDKEKGYTIHYVDQYGNELPSQSNNLKDIESLCVAMVANQIGSYKGNAKDLKAFDKLLEDMYGLMVYHDPETGLPFTYEVSEIYACNHGCEEYTYYCNDSSYYDEINAMKSDEVAFYGDIEPYSERGGCESKEVEVEGWYNEYGDFYDTSDGSYSDIDFENNPYMTEGTGTRTEYYCPGHTVPVCYGHRDIDIYITLYDLDYAFENNLYPEDWASKPYKGMIKEFISKGGWKNWWQKIARNYKGGDWMDLYGIDPDEGSAGFSTENILSEEEIQKILDEYDGDISAAREALIQCALDAVGKIPYYWGGKSLVPGLDDNNFGSTVSPDYKGRTKKGLDCSGFVQWVYNTALGVKVSGSTAGYCSNHNKISYSDLKPGDVGLIKEPGASSNHIGIYAGRNSDGQDMWIHCTGAPKNTVVYGSYSFKYFYDPLAN